MRHVQLERLQSKMRLSNLASSSQQSRLDATHEEMSSVYSSLMRATLSTKTKKEVLGVHEV